MKWLVGGLCLTAAAVVELVSTFASVSLSGSPQQVLSAIAANPTGLKIESYSSVVLPVLLVPGLLPTLGIVGTQGRNFIYVGTCLTLMGGFGHAVVGVAGLSLLGLATSGNDRGQMANLVDPVAINALAVGLPLLFVAFVGLVVWVIGLLRAKWIAVWVLVVYVVWFLVQSPLGTPLTNSHWGLLVSQVPFAVVFGWIGIRMIQQAYRLSEAKPGAVSTPGSLPATS